MKHRFKSLMNLLMQSPSSRASVGDIDLEIRLAVTADLVHQGTVRLNPRKWEQVLQNLSLDAVNDAICMSDGVLRRRFEVIRVECERPTPFGS